MLHRNLLRLEAGTTIWHRGKYVDFITVLADIFYFIVFSVSDIFLTQRNTFLGI